MDSGTRLPKGFTAQILAHGLERFLRSGWCLAIGAIAPVPSRPGLACWA